MRLIRFTLLIISFMIMFNTGQASGKTQKQGNTMPNFNYPKQVTATALANLNKALKSGDGEATVDALVQYSIATSNISADELDTIIARIDSVKSLEKRPAYKALLNYFEAVVLKAYCDTYIKYDRRNPEGEPPAKYSEWDKRQFATKCAKLVQASVADSAALVATPITTFKRNITYNKQGALYIPTLYQFLCKKGIDLLNNYVDISPEAKQCAQRLWQLWLQSTAGNDAARIYCECEQARSNDNQFDNENDENDKNASPFYRIYTKHINSQHSGMPLCELSERKYYDDLNNYLRRFPTSIYANEIHNNIESIEAKNIVLDNKHFYASTDSITVQANVQNVNEFKIQVYSVPASITDDNYYRASKSKLKLIDSRNFKVSGKVPFDTVVECKLPPLPYGRYLLFSAFYADGKLVENNGLEQPLRITDIAMFKRNGTNEPRVFAVDFNTGAPQSGVLIQNKGNKGLTTGKDGYVTPTISRQSSNYTANRGKDCYAYTSGYLDTYSPSDYIALQATIFTDLGIYRPGETVKWTAIAYRNSKKLRSTAAGEKLQAVLCDANGKDIDTALVTTDEHGRACGQFTIPTGRLNGNYRITLRTTQKDKRAIASKGIKVSEYKTPTFSITFTDAKTSYTAGQDIHITGKVQTYSGMPLQNRNVNLLLNSRSWAWWQNSGSRTVCDTAVTTNAQGEFSVTLPKALFGGTTATGEHPKRHIDFLTYTLNASCTSADGETQSQGTQFWIGQKRSITSTSSDWNFVNHKPIKFPVNLQSTSSADEHVQCTYSVARVSGNDSTVVASGSYYSDDPTIDLTKLQSGQYIIAFAVAGDPTADTLRTDVVLYRPNDANCPVAEAVMWLPKASQTVDKNNVAHALIGTSTSESHIYYIATTRDSLVAEGWLHYKPGMHEFKTKIPAGENLDLTVSFIAIHHGQSHSETATFHSATNEKSINIHATSFRDKLVPGNKETWTFTLQNKNKNPQFGMMLLSMTDAAINSLQSNMWSLYFDYPTWSAATVQQFYNQESRSYNYWRASQHDINEVQYPSFNLYNRALFASGIRPGRVCLAVSRLAMAKKEANSNSIQAELNESKQEVVVAADAVAVAAFANNVIDKKLPQLRTDAVKTALWKPMLTTDANGNISIEFDVPNFNTTWDVKAIAFTDGLLTDNFMKQAVASKPLMVKTNAPRFVRQGDATSLTASVQNATEDSTQCQAVMELFDPRTRRVYATSPVTQFNLPAKGTGTVSVNYTVPDTIPFLGIRVVATAGAYSDGEQLMTPVLPSVQPVVETQPFYLDAGTASAKLAMPKAPQGARITLEYCDNPVWYCVTALPTIYSSNFNTSTSLAHNLFALMVAQGVAKSNPQIKEAIAYWKANAQDSTLVSSLQRNGDLKIGTLEASPWINEAERQTLRMSRLNKLFDPDVMESEQNRIIEALENLQMSDGGWTWLHYPGCRSSIYATHEVLELIGELQHLGYLTSDARIGTMVNKALRYYDDAALELYNKQRKRRNKDYSNLAPYVYVRTLFPDVKLSPQCSDMLKNALNAMRTGWQSVDLCNKAYYAMALNRNGYKATAKQVIESIRQFAITKPQSGMYWDNLQSGWWYFDKVAITATILEAFNEVDPRKSEIDQIRKWMLLMKQTNDWGSSSLAADAVYALLSTGSQWLAAAIAPQVEIGDSTVEFGKMDQYLGYARKQVNASSGATLSIARNSASPAWGAVYVQYSGTMKQLKEASVPQLSISKQYYAYAADGSTRSASTFKVGDKVQVRTVIVNDKDLDYVTVSDERAACCEPADQTSEYRIADGTWYYQETKDAQTNLFFTSLPKGTHVISYDVYITAPGQYSAGIAAAQCQYAPQVAAHSAGATITVK